MIIHTFKPKLFINYQELQLPTVKKIRKNIGRSVQCGKVSRLVINIKVKLAILNIHNYRHDLKPSQHLSINLPLSAYL